MPAVRYDPERNLYVCPGGKELKKYRRAFVRPRDGLTKDGTMIYFARKHNCEACALKPKCCPNVPSTIGERMFAKLSGPLSALSIAARMAAGVGTGSECLDGP